MTMIEMLVKDIRDNDLKSAIVVRQGEWGGWYVSLLGQRVGTFHQTMGDAQEEAIQWCEKIFGTR